MTDWLVHFTRANGPTPAREVIRTILVEGALRPAFAVRGAVQRATIYGTRPAVCFTEQPLEAFSTYLAERNDPSAMDGYGVLVHKHDVFAYGGLPVIYGLCANSEAEVGDAAYNPGFRCLKEACLPPDEQFRYVAFAPTRYPYPMDWTHEREWRWAPSASLGPMYERFYLGIPFGTGDRGSFQCRVHAFVRSDADVSWLQGQLASAIAKEEFGGGGVASLNYKEYWRLVLPKLSIISLETVRRELEAKHDEFARFETLPDTAKHSVC